MIIELATSGGILLIGAPRDSRLAKLPRSDSPTRAALRMYGRSALQDPIATGRVRRLLAETNLHIPTGLSDHDALLEALDVGLAQKTLIGIFVPRTPIGALAKPPPPPASARNAAAFAQMSPSQRIALLLERTPAELAPDLARAFRSMVTVEALAGIAAAFAVLLAAQFFGVGEIADAGLAWWAYSQAGFAGLTGLYELLRAVVACVQASDERAFDQAVKHFAEGLTLVGVAVLTVVVTRAARRRAGGAEGGSGGGHGDDAPQNTRSKVGGAAAAETAAARRATAKAFYEQAGWDENRIDAHLRGIDFNQDVSVTTLQQGQTVTQWVDPARGTGNYFAPSGTTPDALGISGDNRVLQTYTLTQDTQVLQSTAAPITPEWDGPNAAPAGGGATQWFAPNTSNFQPTGGGP